MDPVKRDAILFDLPEASGGGVAGNRRTNSNGDADLLHFRCCERERAQLTSPFSSAEFEFFAI